MQIACRLHVVFILIFIIYIFYYLLQLTSAKQVEATTCINLLMEIASSLNVLFVLISNIYLFTYSKVCQQKQRKSPPVFIYLCKSLVVTHGFHFNIHYLFVYLFKVMSTKTGGSNHLFLFTYANCLLITCGFRFNIYYLFVYLLKAM